MANMSVWVSNKNAHKKHMTKLYFANINPLQYGWSISMVDLLSTFLKTHTYGNIHANNLLLYG